MFVDTHCHLFKDYYDNLEVVINNMENNIIIVSGTNFETNKEVIELCNKYTNIFGTIGYHPSELDNFSYEHLELIENCIDNPKIVGIGEIGLDYYWKIDNKEFQQQIFKKQLDLAKKYNKTVVIHSRDALEDTYNILSKNEYRNLKINLHCYSYNLEMAQKFIKLGIMLGVGGIITFDNAKLLKEVVTNVDLDHLLLETDSPFLTPVPHRGKLNYPINIKLIAEKIAEIKNINVETVYEITTNNAFRQFDLKLDL